MKEFGIIVKIGGRSKAVLRAVRKIKYSRGKSYGLTEYYGPEKGPLGGCKIWIYSRQSPREIADTFFHEMTHVFLQMLGDIRKQGDKEEVCCRGIGCLAKEMLTNYDQKKYGRKAHEAI